MSKKGLIWGGLFGLVAPFIGIFLGLQVSTFLGDILAFPVIGLSYLTGTPFGMWGWELMIVALLFSILVWAVTFGITEKILKRA